MSFNLNKSTLPISSDMALLLFSRLMELLPDHVYFKDLQGRFLCVNQAMARFFNLGSPVEMIGKSDFDFFERSLAQQKFDDEQQILRSGVGFIGKIERGDSPEGERWVLTSKLPLTGEDSKIIGTFGISRDITEMKQAREALEAQHRLLQTLIEILPCNIFIKDACGRIQLTNQAYRRAIGGPELDSILGKTLEDLVRDDPRTATVSAEDMAIIETGMPILNREQFDASPIGDKRWTLLSKVPLLGADGKVRGIVGMSADITAQKESEARAVRAQQELKSKNLQVESELDMAREMQMELMTAGIQSVRETIDLAAPFAPQIVFAYEPCQHLAGDFFQATPLSRQQIGLLVCDVMGHGVKAALVTTLLRGLLSEMTARASAPSFVLASLNERLCMLLDRPSFPRFVTALYGTLDVQSGVLCVSNAGHPWPLILDREGNVRALSTGEACPALGLLSGTTYESAEVRLNPGDRILFYTDGLKEEHNWAGDEFGQERLAESFQRGRNAVPAEALHTILQDLRAFSGSVSSGDDLCAVMLGF